MDLKIRTQDALDYHEGDRPGKIEVVPTKPFITQRDLSLAYTPGVAEPCRAIQADPDAAFRYTARGNLVAVVSNGTAVLGLGNIGPLASKPVMEGKGVLFKKFADIDVFDLEIDAPTPADVIRVVKALEPTFGGINLEDIKSPDCFEIEETLREIMEIPVFHDDQHGTAIISGAALLNAVELAGKRLDEIRVVFSGAGAAAMSCALMYVLLGVDRQKITLTDVNGVIHSGRTDLNRYQQGFAHETENRMLAEAVVGVDVLVGLSVGGIVKPEMVASMAENPIVFALANPDPEISYEVATAVRPDLIMATGRSDYPNQVNNVLGFPYIFRGALDVRARRVTEGMKIAAARALAALARAEVPDSVVRAYGGESIAFGRLYLIPKPFDPRVLTAVAPAVALAAIADGVARQPITDWERYRRQLEDRLGLSKPIMRNIVQKAQGRPRRIVFTNGEHPKILRAAQILLDQRIAFPILLGPEAQVRGHIEALGLELAGAEIVDPATSERTNRYVEELYRARQRKGMTLVDAKEAVRSRRYFGAMMVKLGHADGMVAGLTQHYPRVLAPALRVLGSRPDVRRVSALHIISTKRGPFFFADTSVNVDPSAEELAEIAILTAETVRRFDVEPRIAMVSFSNFGSVDSPEVRKVREATALIWRLRPDLMVDGDIQVEVALTPEIRNRSFPFSLLEGAANVFIFPNLAAGNSAFQLMQRLADAEVIGPILMGMDHPVHVLQRDSEVADIVNMAAVAVAEANDRDSQPAVPERDRFGRPTPRTPVATDPDHR